MHRIDEIDLREAQRRRIVLDTEVQHGRVTEREANNLSVIAMLVSQSLRDDVYWTERSFRNMQDKWLKALDDIATLHYAVRQAYARIEELEYDYRLVSDISADRLERIMHLEESILDCPHHAVTSTTVIRALDLGSDSEDSQMTELDTTLLEDDV